MQDLGTATEIKMRP